MRITAVRNLVVNAEMRNWVFVKVETSDPGLYGWGECSLEWKTRSLVGAVEDFAPMVVGEDPTRIEHLYQKIYRQSECGFAPYWLSSSPIRAEVQIESR